MCYLSELMHEAHEKERGHGKSPSRDVIQVCICTCEVKRMRVLITYINGHIRQDRLLPVPLIQHDPQLNSCSDASSETSVSIRVPKLKASSLPFWT